MIDVIDRSHAISLDAKLSKIEEAVLILEDRRFFSHQGFDWRSIAREIFRALTGKRHGGASTIDMQLFRTISGRYERTARRKLREIVGSRILQHKCSKIQILRVYLDCAYFGTGLIGVGEACYSLYAKYPLDLTEEEAFRIASMLVYPKPRIASADWEAKIARRAQYGRTLLVARKKSNKQVIG